MGRQISFFHTLAINGVALHVNTNARLAVVYLLCTHCNSFNKRLNTVTIPADEPKNISEAIATLFLKDL